MARTKRSPALFEVIHSGKQTDKTVRQGILRTPKWWFKGSGKSVDDGTSSAVTENPAPAMNPAPSTAVDESRTQARTTVSAPGSWALPVSYFNKYSNLAARSGILCSLDNERQEVSIRIRYTSAIIAGFAIIVLLSLAYLTGRHSGQSPAMASGLQTSEDLRQGPAAPGVLDVGTTPAGEEASVQSTVDQGESATTPPLPARDEQSTILDTNPQRSIGLNYVIVQSYPEETLAAEACEFLRRNGIACTVVKGPAAWTPNWYSVVGIAGFKSGFSSSREYNEYVEQIERLGEEFAGRSSFKRFEPKAYRWREQL